MARRERIITPEAQRATGLQFVYTNATIVGRGADNKRIDDIQLVQVFLHVFFKRFTILFEHVAKPPRPTAQGILIDGIVGPQTVSAITVFQKVINKSGADVTVDGRVSVPKRGGVVPGTKTPYTIVSLNSFFFFESEEDLAFNENLEDHPLLQTTPHLVAELKRRKALE